MNQSTINIKQSFGLFGLYIIITLGVSLIASAFGQNAQVVFFTSLITNLLIITVALNWQELPGRFLIAENRSIPELHFVIGCFFTLCLGVTLDPILNLYPMPDWMVEMMEMAIQKNAWSFLALAVVAPLGEEFLFRRIILTGLESNYGKRKAILWSAFFFALFHLNPWQGLGAFVSGIFLAWLYLNTRNIWLCVAIHAFHNSIAFLAFYLSGDVMITIVDIVGYDYKLGLIIGLSIVSMYFCYKYFEKAFRQNPIANWNEDPDATEQAKPLDH
ncbi:MAG: CPBP family intramembrane metalloprotease [Cyclobacteriaceae bacterium]